MVKRFIYSVLVVLVLLSCDETPPPKPHGFLRIDLPQRSYEKVERDCPFVFKKSSVAKIEDSDKSPCYFNIEYPNFNAKFHISYAPIKGDLKELIDQEYQIREKHNQFATNVKERVFQNPEKRVNALLFNINGTKAATPLQFFITDSTNHFFRGVLYFYNSPNNDSLAPVISYLKEDLDSLVESFEWR